MDSPTNGEAGAPPSYTIFRNKHGIPQFEPKRGTQALKDALIYAFPTLETELQLMQAALRKFFDSERGSRSVFELPENDLQTGLAKGKDGPDELAMLQPANAALKNFNFAAGLRTPSRSSWRSSTRPSSKASSRASSRTSSRTRMSSRAESPYLPQEPPEGGAGIMTTWSLASGQELERRRRQPYDPIKRRRVAENRGNACEKHRASKTSCDPSICPQNKLYSKVTRELRRKRSSLASQEGSYGSSTPAKEDFAEMDAPWDGTDQGMDFDDQESMLSLDHTTTTMSSGSWTDQPSGRSPWNSFSMNQPIIEQPTGDTTSLYPLCISSEKPINDSTLEEAGMLQQEYHNIAPFQNSAHNQVLTAIPQATPEELWMASGETGEPFKCNEDPFMGWANKQASKAFDDYSWVISHVESL